MSRVITIPTSRTAPLAHLDGRTVLVLADGVALALPAAHRDSVCEVIAAGSATVTASQIRSPADPAELVSEVALVAGDHLLLVSDGGSPWRVAPIRTATETIATTGGGWTWVGSWTVTSSQTVYTFATASAIAGSVASGTPIHLSSLLTVDGAAQELGEYTLSALGLSLASSPPPETVGATMTLRCRRS